MTQIRITRPCDEDWDAMRGGTHRRYCDRCERSVHDLSTLTRLEAEILVSQRDELDRPPCVQYAVDGAGTLIFEPELLRPERRFGRFVAVAALAVVGVGAAAVANRIPATQAASVVEPMARPGAGSIMSAEPMAQLEASVALAVAAAGREDPIKRIETPVTVDQVDLWSKWHKRVVEGARRAAETAVGAAPDLLIRAKIRRVVHSPEVQFRMVKGGPG